MEPTATAEPVVVLTQNAAQELKVLLEKPENAGKGLRVSIEQGGCSGMQYSMVLDELRPDDLTSQAHGVCVLVDPFSAKYLRGAVVDVSETLSGSGFRISNPNARQICGCGNSFAA